MNTSTKIDHVSQNSKNKKNRNFYFFVSFVATSFILAFMIGGFILGKEKANKQQSSADISQQVKIDSENLPDTPDKWQTYKLEELGIELKLPERLSKEGEWKEQVILASKGSVVCFSNKISEDTFCQGNLLFAGGSSTDFSEDRENKFTDFQGFTEKNNKFYAKTPGGNEIDLINTKFREMKNINGVEIIKILGESELNESILPGTPGKGYLGAIINTKNSKYPGLSIQLKIDSEISEYEFDQILESIKFINS